MALNVITAKFCSGANQTWTEETYQWDYGQVLQFDGLELPEAYQVHFSNVPLTGTTITQIGGADGVTVPDQFFLTGETIYAWVYLHEGEDDGETVYMVTIPVKKRPQPSDDVPTPVEQSAIDQAIAALNIAVEKADEAITHYPTIIDGTWHVWDVTEEEYVDTGVQAQGQDGQQGQPGRDGTDGQDGQDGFSPVITVTDITGGHRVTITTATGTQTVDVMNGQPGTPGTDGTDGYSPTVTVTEITGGHRVTITDAQGAHTFDVMDGQGGSVTVDDELSTTSENPVQNRVITEAVNDVKADLSELSDDVSGDILQLNADISQKAPGIFADSSKAYAHKNLSGAKSIDFYGNSLAFGTAKYADAENIYPGSASATSKTAGNVTLAINGRFIKLNGVCNQNYGTEIIDRTIPECPAGDYTLYVKVYSQGSTIAYERNSSIAIRYTDESTNTSFDVLLGDSDTSVTFTATKPFNRIRYFQAVTNGSTYNNMMIWLALFPKDTVITDTGQSVASDGTYTYSIQGVGSPVIDTMQHESTVISIVDTKTYVDALDVDVSQKLVYISPEMFGAVGDGVTDDTQALNDCISYATQSISYPYPKAAIRGYGKYKTTSGISLHGRNLDAFLNYIKYTGNDVAVTLIGAYCKFRFGRIEASTGQAAVGIKCTTTPSPTYLHDGFTANLVECADIISGGNTVEIIYPSTASSEAIYYNILRFQNQHSLNGNIIYTEGKNISELDIYGKHIQATNGYIYYDASHTSHNTTHVPRRLHQFSMEDAKNGIFGNVSMFECRTRELMDKRLTVVGGGYLFDFTGVVPTSYKDGAAGDVDMRAIKADDALVFSDVIELAKDAYDNGDGNYQIASILGHEGKSYAKLENCVRAGSTSPTILPPGDVYVYYNHVAYKPYEPWYYQVTEDMVIDKSGNDYVGYTTPTVFDINASSVNIYLDFSYCCIAINEFELIQHTGKAAIVYDKLGNKIFDGTNQGEGVYRFVCSRVPINPFVIEMRDGTEWSWTGSNRIYTGENETWTITKETPIETIDSQFRVIKTITLTADTSRIYVNTDSDGNAFSLKDVVIDFNLTASTGSGVCGIFPNAPDQSAIDGTQLPNLCANGVFSTSANRRYAHLEVRGGKLFGESTNGSNTNWYSATPCITSKNACGTVDCQNIKSLTMYSLNNYVFASGSTITIYGR